MKNYQQLEEDNKQKQKAKSRDFTPVYVWGSDACGQLGLANQEYGKFYQSPRFCSFSVIIQQIACGEEHTAFIDKKGYIYTMGNNSQGQLGIQNSQIQSKSTPQLVENLRKNKAQHIACGANHTIAIIDNGIVMAWGQGCDGQLGIGTKENQYEPKQLNSLINNAQQIYCGQRTTFIITNNSVLYGFGDNKYGQLGNGSKQNEYNPKELYFPIKNIKSISCGDMHTLILNEEGEVYAVGNNQFGQLGLEEKSSTTIPQKINFSNDGNRKKITQIIAAKQPFSSAISEKGELYLWGKGFFGQYNKPTLIKFIQWKIKEINIGSNFMCLLDENGTIYSWGKSNLYGELGLGESINLIESNQNPVQLQKLKDVVVTKVVCGSSFTIALGENWIHYQDQIQQNNNNIKQNSSSNNHVVQINDNNYKDNNISKQQIDYSIYEKNIKLQQPNQQKLQYQIANNKYTNKYNQFKSDAAQILDTPDFFADSPSQEDYKNNQQQSISPVISIDDSQLYEPNISKLSVLQSNSINKSHQQNSSYYKQKEFFQQQQQSCLNNQNNKYTSNDNYNKKLQNCNINQQNQVQNENYHQQQQLQQNQFIQNQTEKNHVTNVNYNKMQFEQLIEENEKLKLENSQLKSKILYEKEMNKSLSNRLEEKAKRLRQFEKRCELMKLDLDMNRRTYELKCEHLIKQLAQQQQSQIKDIDNYQKSKNISLLEAESTFQIDNISPSIYRKKDNQIRAKSTYHERQSQLDRSLLQDQDNCNKSAWLNESQINDNSINYKVNQSNYMNDSINKDDIQKSEYNQNRYISLSPQRIKYNDLQQLQQKNQYQTLDNDIYQQNKYQYKKKDLSLNKKDLIIQPNNDLQYQNNQQKYLRDCTNLVDPKTCSAMQQKNYFYFQDEDAQQCIKINSENIKNNKNGSFLFHNKENYRQIKPELNSNTLKSFNNQNIKANYIQ